MSRSVDGSSPSMMDYFEENVGVAAVRAGNAIVSATMNTLQTYWRVIRWLGTSIILGGLAISVLISFATTGSPGLTDPNSWPIVRLFFAYPEISWSVLGAAAFFALCGILAQRLSPAKPTTIESEQYILQQIRTLDTMDFVPGYQDVYLFRSKGNLDRDARTAVRNAALRKRHTAGNPNEGSLGICIYGRPTEGKTRLAWETIRAVLPGWTLLKWPYNHPEFGLRRQVLRRRRVVLWLDDLQKYDPDAIRELKDLPRRLVRAHARFVIVATCRDGQDEVRVQQDLASIVGRLQEFRLTDMTQDEASRLNGELTKAGISVEEASFDGSPGSLLLGLADMRKAYTQLQDDAKRILRGLKLLRSIGIYEYPIVHVLAAAGAQGRFDRPWANARDSLIIGRFLRLGARDESGQPSLIPVADVYVDSVVFDFPMVGSKLDEFWPALQQQFEQRSDSNGLLALGNTYLSHLESSESPDTHDPVEYVSLAHHCYDMGLQFVTASSDPGTWARLHANLGKALIKEASDTAPPRRVDLLQEAIKHFQAALIVSEESYPSIERIGTDENMAAASIQLSRLTRTPATTVNRQRDTIRAYVHALQLIERDDDPIRWANTQRSIGLAYREMAEFEPGFRAVHLDAAKKAYHQALTVFTRAKHPAKWAELQQLLGNANWRRAEGARQPMRDRVLSEASTAYANALTFFTASTAPIEWATTQFEVARLYLLRAKFHEGMSRAAYKSDLQKGKACIDAAFTIMNQEAFPHIWVEAQRAADELETQLRALGVSVSLTNRQSA